MLTSCANHASPQQAHTIAPLTSTVCTVAEIKTRKPNPPSLSQKLNGKKDLHRILDKSTSPRQAPPHCRPLTPDAEPPLMSFTSARQRRTINTGPELRQDGRGEDSKEKQGGNTLTGKEGLRRRHDRSRAGRTPNPNQIYFISLLHLSSVLILSDHSKHSAQLLLQ